MARSSVPATTSSRLSRVPLGPKLIGFGVALFVVTRIVVWLPLGFVGSWINGFLWSILLISIAVGAGLTYVRAKRAA